MNVALKSTMIVLALFALAVGFTACAKYPVVMDAPVSSPAPTR
jgi:hypothetical protein